MDPLPNFQTNEKGIETPVSLFGGGLHLFLFAVAVGPPVGWQVGLSPVVTAVAGLPVGSQVLSLLPVVAVVVGLPVESQVGLSPVVTAVAGLPVGSQVLSLPPVVAVAVGLPVESQVGLSPVVTTVAESPVVWQVGLLPPVVAAVAGLPVESLVGRPPVVGPALEIELGAVAGIALIAKLLRVYPKIHRDHDGFLAKKQNLTK